MNGADLHGLCTFCRTAMQHQHRTATRQVLHFKLAPANPPGDTGAQRLGTCLFCGEAGGQAFRGIALLSPAVCNFSRGVDTMQKPVTIPRNSLLNTIDLGQVSAGSNNQKSAAFLGVGR